MEFGWTLTRVQKTIFIDKDLWEKLKPYFKQQRSSFSREIELFLRDLSDRLDKEQREREERNAR